MSNSKEIFGEFGKVECRLNLELIIYSVRAQLQLQRSDMYVQ